MRDVCAGVFYTNLIKSGVDLEPDLTKISRRPFYFVLMKFPSYLTTVTICYFFLAKMYNMSTLAEAEKIINFVFGNFSILIILYLLWFT